MGKVLGVLTTAYLYEHEPIDLRLVVIVKKAKSRGLTLDGAFYYIRLAIWKRQRWTHKLVTKCVNYSHIILRQGQSLVKTERSILEKPRWFTHTSHCSFCAVYAG